jgi:S-DNA-T family DNA segregation ATPase FtsK/SpoIIIE
MQMVVLGWFGWSVLWVVPLLGRLFKAIIFRKMQLHGQGSIRLWLGTLLMLCASSALEALIRRHGSAPGDSAVFGQMLATSIVDSLGAFLGVLLLLTIAAIAMPWLFGRGAFRFFAWCYGACRRVATGLRRQEVSQPPKLIAKEDPPARSRLGSTRVAGTDQTRRTEPWKLPAPSSPKKSLRPAAKTTSVQDGKTSGRTPGRTSNGRPSDEWAPFESIRPTSAMLARANASARAAPTRATPKSVGRISTPPHQTAAQQTRESVEKPVIGKITRSMFPAPAATTHSSAPGKDQRPQTADLSVTPCAPTPDMAAQAANDANRYAAVAAGWPASMKAEMPTEEKPEIDAQSPHIPAQDDHPIKEPKEMHTEPSESKVAAPYVSEPVPEAASPSFSAPSEFQAQPATALSLVPDPVQPAEGFAVVRPAAVASRPRVVMGTQFEFQAPSEISVDLPGLDLLDAVSGDVVEIPVSALAETGHLIEQRLKEFKVPVTVLGACAGPVITRFEVEPAVGVRGAQIVGLVKDLSRALGLTSIRVVETIPGKTCMGLELPNAQRQMIRLSEMIESDAYRASPSHLTLAMGKDITGTPVVTDLARAPHMLVAGTTGSGKSVAINAMILSLLYKSTPADVRMIMIDPKMLELSVYDGIPHLLAPVVTDMKLAANALSWCVTEMDKRYRIMSALGVRNLAGFNQKIRDGEAAEKKITNPFSLTPDAPEPLSTLPMIVVVIDELADLMMVAGKKIEELIARLAQKARAAGIHLILATQRPSVDVITGLIKANIPTRVAFQVSSKIDSRTVLDQMGAETLLGHGDMLFLPPGSGYPQRVHGAFVSDEEVHRVVEYLKQFGEPEYEDAILAGAPSEEAAPEALGDEGNAEADPLYDEAVAFVIRTRRASISSVQRQLRIGYNRAARMVEQMEVAGILSTMASNGSREILAPPMVD